MFQKVARFAIKWTFDIREEISHFSKNMSQFRLRSSIERTLNRQLSRTGDDMGLINVWDNFNFTQDIFDFHYIGSLNVTVHKADLTDYKFSKINLFCKLELVNKKYYTKIEPKTLTPNWGQSFKFKIKDITGPRLEISIYYETALENSKLVGNISLPLLKIQNRTRKWFVLQHKSKDAIKGKIFLEFEISYNPIKAALKTIFTPKEINKALEDGKIRFNKTHFLRNVIRLKHILLEFLESAKFFKSCLEWDCPIRTLTGLSFVLIFIYYIEWYMLPLTLLLIMLRNFVMMSMNQNYFEQTENDNLIAENKFKSDKFHEKIDQTVNFLINTLLENSSFIDRIENLFNFTVPFLSWVFIVALAGSTVCYYFISMRLVIMAFVINEFTKEFRKVHSCSHILCNNEFYNFFSRVPDMDEING